MTDETTEDAPAETVTVRPDPVLAHAERQAVVDALVEAGGDQAVRVGWEGVQLPPAAATADGTEVLEGELPSGRKRAAKKAAPKDKEA